MAVFMLQLADGQDKVIEADVAGRTLAGDIVLERADLHGNWTTLETYRAADVVAVYRRGPAESGIYTWIPQSTTGTWWCY
ncbi:hypothetical protein [Streptomyces sp. URMC 125]|uniref:hypothetical protein n=1 Tax=Streptomyces sp. URMC 125 TaxID=3423419 RepID=UPI003F1AF2F3